jgi:Fe2+ transport system protein B
MITKAHFISDANSYMFPHQGAIVREFFSNNDSYFQKICYIILVKMCWSVLI